MASYLACLPASPSLATPPSPQSSQEGSSTTHSFAPNLPKLSHLTQNKIQNLCLGQWGPTWAGPAPPLVSPVTLSYSLCQSYGPLCRTLHTPNMLLSQSLSKGSLLYLESSLALCPRLNITSQRGLFSEPCCKFQLLQFLTCYSAFSS